MNHRDRSRLVRYLDTGLKVGLFKPEDLINWADEMILKNITSDRLFIEISLSDNKSVQYLLDIINEFQTPDEPLVEAKYFFSLLHKKYFSGQLPLDKTMEILYRLIFKSQMSKDEERSIRKMDSIFETFYGSYGNDSRQKTVRDFLAIYKDIEIPYPIF